jgi:hypothetical protein
VRASRDEEDRCQTWEIDDALCARIGPLLPAVPRNQRRPDRKRLDSRKVLCGILSELWAADLLDFSPAAADSSHIRALKGGRPPVRHRWTGATPAASTT